MKHRLKLNNLNRKHLKIVGVILLILALPLTLLLVRQVQNYRSSAALPDKLETEGGVLSSTGVSKQSDSNTSGGQFVRFSRSSAPTPTPSQGGLGPRGHVGPRYDLYGAGSGGNFPQLGTEPSGGSPVSWSASNVYVVPDRVYNSSDVASALATWILSDVPDGANASNPTYIVFDRSHSGENSMEYGNGTLYTFNDNVKLELAGASTVRRNLVFWGYNSKLKFANSPSSIGLMRFERGGWENIYFLGFDLEGPGSGSPSWQSNGFNGASEHSFGVYIFAFSGVKIMDNYIHHTSNFVRIPGWRLASSGGPHHDDWSHGPYSNDMEIAYNEGYNSMNQGISFEQGWNIDIHHNHVHDTRQRLVTSEDTNYNNIGSPARRIENLTIRDNRIGRWNWQSPWHNGKCDPLKGSPISIAQDTPENIDGYGTITISNNEVYGGPMGSMNPTAEAASQCGTCVSCPYEGRITYRDRFGLMVWSKTDKLVVTKNFSNLPQVYVDANDVWGLWGAAEKVTNVSVTENDFQGLDWYFRNVGAINWSNNGESTFTEL